MSVINYMPQFRKGMSKNEWMSKCIPIVMKEGKTQKQAAGQCFGMYKQALKNTKGSDPNWDDFETDFCLILP